MIVAGDEPELDSCVPQETAGTVYSPPWHIAATLVTLSSPVTPGSSSTSSFEGRLRKYRSLSGIYTETEEVQLDDELFLLASEELASYQEAAEEKPWQKAMQQELDAIEKNKTWTLTEY